MGKLRSAVVWLLFLVGGTPAFGQGAPQNQSAERPPVTVNVGTEEFMVAKDGLYTQVSHYEATIANDSAAKEFAQRAFPFSEATDDFEVTEAYTRKSDGRKLPVDPTHIFTQAPQGSGQAPMFNDFKQKIVVFPDVAANDTIVYTITRRAKIPDFPGQFSFTSSFSRLTAWDNVQITITAPKSLPLKVENHDLTVESHSDGDNVVYRFHYSAPMPLAEDVAAIAPLDRDPRIFVTTFKSYDDLGHAFAALALSKVNVTDRIRSIANEATAGITDKREQVKRLYEWVSQHIRYVGIELGRGRIEPHEADAVLQNGYGDCKDHVVIFAALLKAKGIASEMVLINAANSYTQPEAPSLATFNHLITFIPDLKLYADTTAGIAPFGTLPFIEYGKSVVHAVAKGDTRHSIPPLAPGAATMSLKTVSKVTPEGGLQFESQTTATGPFSVLLRLAGSAIEAAGPDRAVKALLQRAGMTGTGQISVGNPRGELADTYSIKSHADATLQVPFTSGQGFPMPPGMRLLPFPGDYLVGPLFVRNLPATEPTPCWSGSSTEDLSIEAPPGKHFAKLPQDTSVKTDHISFSAHWEQNGKVISVHREFTSKVDQPLCSGEVRRSIAETLPKIAAAFPLQISIVDN